MSNNLDLSQIAATQLNKHVTANDQAGQLDAAITEPMAVPVDETNAVTLTAAAFRRHFPFEVEDDTTPPDDAITLTVPALKRGVFAVRNTTAHPVTVTISGQSADPPVVLPGEVMPVSVRSTLPPGPSRISSSCVARPARPSAWTRPAVRRDAARPNLADRSGSVLSGTREEGFRGWIGPGRRAFISIDSMRTWAAS